MTGPLAQTVSDSGVWGAAGGEGVHREKTGPSLKCLEAGVGADLPPQVGARRKDPGAQGLGESSNSAHPAGWAWKEGRAANSYSLEMRRKNKKKISIVKMFSPGKKTI